MAFDIYETEFLLSEGIGEVFERIDQLGKVILRYN